jgi:hypothetical protein
MSEFILGLFLIVVGLRGNAGSLISALAEDGSFVPFIVALAIAYYSWENVPPKEAPAVKTLIVGLGAAVVISQYSRIISGAAKSWAAIEALGNGSFSSTFGGGPSGSGGNPLSSAINTLTGAFGNLTAGQINEESGGKQFTSSGSPLISSAGAVGISQILPSTAQSVAQTFGIPYSESELKNNSLYNEILGSDYMQVLQEHFGGNEQQALAAYNWGPGNVQSDISRNGSNWFSNLPASVQSYVKNAL